MEGQTKSSVLIRGSEFCADAPLCPPSYGWQPSVLYNQHFGLHPLLDFRDLRWMESIYQKLQTSSWSGYTRSPAFPPRPNLHREMAGGLSEVFTQQGRWKVSLDVNHFAPAEITVQTRDGFLEIGGKHNERQDEHGYISRSFLRKYKLPDGAVAERINSVITGDGVITVEVPLPDLAPPADLTVLVQQVEIEPPKLEDQETDIQMQPKKTELGDSVIPPSLEELHGKPAAADERICHGDPDPDDLAAQEGVEVISSQREEKVVEEKPEEVVDLARAAEEVQEHDEKPAESTDLVTPEQDTVIQERENLVPDVEEQTPCDVSEAEVSVSDRAQEDVTVQQAVEQGVKFQ